MSKKNLVDDISLEKKKIKKKGSLYIQPRSVHSCMREFWSFVFQVNEKGNRDGSYLIRINENFHEDREGE